MKTDRIAFAVITPLAFLAVAVITLDVQRTAALTDASSSTTTVPTTTTPHPVVISQALPGQGSIVGGLLLGSSTSTVLHSFATTTAAASTTIGQGILSEHNKVGITGSCVVTQSSNAKQ